MQSSLSISYAASPESTANLPESWLRLEQIITPGEKAGVQFFDLIQMVARARSGLSAHTYKRPGCEVTVSGETVSFPLDFYLWPSALNLDYALAVNTGVAVLEERLQVELEREGNVVMPMQDYAALPWLLAIDAAQWETPCYDEYGSVIGSPGLSADDNLLLTGGVVCFGVVRLKCRAIGYRYRCTVTLDKSEAVAVKDLEVKITARWTDQGEPQEEELSLAIPQCVLDYLEHCPDGSVLPLSRVNPDDDEDKTPTVYYSTCDGSVKMVRYE